VLVPQQRSLTAATLVVSAYLQKDIKDIAASPFMECGEVDGVLSPKFSERMIVMGMIIFSLRREPGLSEVCRRLSNRDLRSAFYELAAAYFFVDLGFHIFARPEIGKSERDYDFAVEKGGEVVSVEATAFTNASYARQTVKNALNTKRKQVPSDRPAVIICFYPGRWLDEVPDLRKELLDVTESFFLRTRRINFVCFIEERFRLEGRKGLSYSVQFTRNKRARYEPEVLLMAIYELLTRHQTYEENSDGSERYLRGSSEFWAWIDWALR